ncbi:MAG TPA: peptidoglycan-associated lipoprotein Pal [Rhodospirillales bacterium]|nr:peptidoglycan-associated lipoprotein Pal [Rhodospirillales bacterium]
MMLAAIVVTVAACETATEETASTGASGLGSTGSSAVSTLPPGGGPAGGPSYGAGSVQRGALGNPAEVERELVGIGDTVFFAFDSFSLDGLAQGTLDRQAALLLKNNGINVTVEGHTDERGTREYNLALGERRATSVKDYLVAFGISPGRIRTISYGEERPAAVGSNETAWAKNRRAVTVVVGGVAGS